MDFLEFCPRDGVELVPSRVMNMLPGWMECPKCGRVYGEPDLDNPHDMGVVMEPYKDFDPDPGRSRIQIKKRGSSVKVRKRNVKKSTIRKWYPLPLPLPRQGESMSGNSSTVS